MRFFDRMCWMVVLAILPAAGACAADPSVGGMIVSTQPAEAAMVRGPWLMHLPGIGGYMGIDRRMLQGLRDGGIPGEFQVFDWTGKERGLRALRDHDRNVQLAAALAGLIRTYRQFDGTDPFCITAHSGGCAIAAWALEKLPPGVQVDTVILLAPALSPKYDLTEALKHVKGKCYVFSSPVDAVLLKTGTRLFGTMDGVNGDAAGLNGFVMPDGADEQQYRKLVPMPYQFSWQQYGNNGDHIGPTSRSFAEAVIAPLLSPKAAATTRP